MQMVPFGEGCRSNCFIDIVGSMKKTGRITSKHVVPNGTRYAPTEPETVWDLEVRSPSNKGSAGLFTKEAIPKGAVIGHAGGVVLSSVADIPKELRYAVLIAKNRYLAPLDYDHLESFCYFNHSCESNTARIGGLIFVAKRAILVGEELTLDYAPLIAGVPEWSMSCGCHSLGCRKVITSEDWRAPKIAAQLWEEWLAFIQKQIMELGNVKC